MPTRTTASGRGRPKAKARAGGPSAMNNAKERTVASKIPPGETASSAKRARPRRVAVRTAVPRSGSTGTSILSPLSLPNEILFQIIRSLDPVADRPSLVNILLVSRTCWDIGAPHLYHNLTLDEVQLHKLLTGAVDRKYTKRSEPYSFRYMQGLRRKGISKLSPRALSAFGFIRKLHLFTPANNAVIVELWAATVPNIVLFPNIESLCLEDPPRYDDGWQARPRYPPDDDVVLFDRPEVCIYRAFSQGRLEYFPRNGTRSLTCHRADITRPSDSPGAGGVFIKTLPRQWQQFRIFLGNPRWFTHHDMNHMELWESKFQPCDQPTIQLCFPENGTVHWNRSLVEAKPHILSRLDRRFQSPTATIQLVFDDNVPPCVVCGKRWLELHDPPQ